MVDEIIEELEMPTQFGDANGKWYVRSTEDKMNFLHKDLKIHDVTYVRTDPTCFGFFDSEQEALEARAHYYYNNGLIKTSYINK